MRAADSVLTGAWGCDNIPVVSAREHLRVDVRSERDRVVLQLAGELDLASAPILQRELDQDAIGDAPAIVFDLDELEFIDSTGLRVILGAHQRARERGQAFAITRGSAQVQRLLSITRVGERLRILPSSSSETPT